MTRPSVTRPSVTRPSATTLRLHATLVAGLALCGVASWIEWRRALGGHELAWAYSFEWPLFAVVGTWIWWRLLHAERAEAEAEGLDGTELGPGRPAAGRPGAAMEDDPELAAWQEYLERLHAVDPPGGPPRR